MCANWEVSSEQSKPFWILSILWVYLQRSWILHFPRCNQMERDIQQSPSGKFTHPSDSTIPVWHISVTTLKVSGPISDKPDDFVRDIQWDFRTLSPGPWKTLYHCWLLLLMTSTLHMPPKNLWNAPLSQSYSDLNTEKNCRFHRTSTIFTTLLSATDTGRNLRQTRFSMITFQTI